MILMVYKVVAIVLYFAMMLAIGGIYYKKSNSLSDYILGGRGLGSWVAAMSAQASDMSGWLLMGLPGAIYFSGLGEAWIGIGLAIGTYLNWLLIAKRLRVYTEVSGNSLTIPEFFENRFKVKGGAMRLVSGLFIFFFFLIYTASGFSAGGKLFEQIIGINYQVAVIISAAIIIAYTFMGGFMAVCWTDFIQGLLMIFAIVVVPIVTVFALGGMGQARELIFNAGPAFNSLFKGSDGSSITAISIISSLVWGLGYCGMPHILVRFMAIREAGMLKKSRRIATIWVVISLFCSCIIGLLGHVYLGEGALTKATSETVFIVLADRLMPAFIAGVIISAILAAIMSTADSQLLVVASSVSSDIMPKLLKKDLDDKKLVWVSRVTIIIVSIVACIIALDENSSIMNLVSYAWAGFGSAFGPCVIMSLYWKRFTYKGALASMVVGGLTVIVWESLKTPFGLYSLAPGFVLALLAGIAVTLMDGEPDEQIQNEFDKVQKQLSEN